MTTVDVSTTAEVRDVATANSPDPCPNHAPALRSMLDHHLARYLPLAIVTLVFFGSRATYFWVGGVRFHEYGIDFACQTLDLQLLRHDLLRSVFYLHHQAPLFNLLIGILYQLFPVHHADAFAAVHVALGFGFAISILSVLRSLGVGPRLRTVATILYCISPAVITYEWWSSYHQLGASLLGMSLAAFCLFLRGGGSRAWGHTCFALLALVVLARSVYGLSWMVLIVGILLVYRPVPRQLVLRVAALPLLLIFLYTIKTPLQTGRSFGHALTGSNLVLKIKFRLPSATSERLFAEGKLSPYSRQAPFFVPSSIPELQIRLRKTGIPALDDERKANGLTNANCLQHVYFGDAYMKDAKWLLTHFTGTYLAAVWDSLSVEYLKASADVAVVPDTQPYRATARIHKIWEKLFLKHKERYWGLTVGLPLSLLYGILWLIGPRARLSSSRTLTPTIAVMVLTILNTTATTLISWGDFNRYRFDVDAYFYVLFVLFACGVWSRMRVYLPASFRFSATR